MSLVLSLFPGIGLLDSAFEAEDFCVVRGPDVIWGGDIRQFHPPSGKFDGAIGGPPCQSFSSLVHLVRANGHEPRFGNLIPEFERCILEAQPDWFLMENVPQAPEPFGKPGDDTTGCLGYGVKSFLLDNSALAGEGGFGLEQRRVRRFSFGMKQRRREDVPNLLRWIDMATFLLPDATATVSQCTPDNSQEAKRRTGPPVGHGEPPGVREAKRRQVTVTSTDGGVRPSERSGPVTAGHMNPAALTERKRSKAVSASNGGNGSQRNTPGAGNAGKGRYKLADACRLQGLPEGFLSDAPFTADGKLKAVANGVPIPMGRAIARAVKEALRCE